MSIITCPECQEKVSTRAAACPHCGAPVTAAVEPSKPAVAEAASKPSVQAPAPSNVNKKVGLKMIGLVFILIGAALLVYQIVSPSGAQLSQLQRDISAGGSGSTAAGTLRYLPSFVLFILGGVLWKAGS